MFMVLSSCLSHYKSSPVHAMNVEQRQVAADLWTKSTNWSHKPACRQLTLYIHHHLNG